MKKCICLCKFSKTPTIIMKRIIYLLLVSAISMGSFAQEKGIKGGTTFFKLNIFLEGPFNDAKMNTDLNKANQIPLSQPYNVPPWNYNGNETVAEIPNGAVVDWVLVDIRTADSIGAATSETIFGRKAAFLMNDGTIFNIDGTTLLSFDSVFT